MCVHTFDWYYKTVCGHFKSKYLHHITYSTFLRHSLSLPLSLSKLLPISAKSPPPTRFTGRGLCVRRSSRDTGRQRGSVSPATAALLLPLSLAAPLRRSVRRCRDTKKGDRHTTQDGRTGQHERAGASGAPPLKLRTRLDAGGLPVLSSFFNFIFKTPPHTSPPLLQTAVPETETLRMYAVDFSRRSES